MITIGSRAADTPLQRRLVAVNKDKRGGDLPIIVTDVLMLCANGKKEEEKNEGLRTTVREWGMMESGGGGGGGNGVVSQGQETRILIIRNRPTWAKAVREGRGRRNGKQD